MLKVMSDGMDRTHFVIEAHNPIMIGQRLYISMSGTGMPSATLPDRQKEIGIVS